MSKIIPPYYLQREKIAPDVHAQIEANVGQTSHVTVGRVRELPVHDELGAMFIVESSDLHLHGHYVRLSFHKTQDAQRH